MPLIRVRGDGFELKGGYIGEGEAAEGAALRTMLVRHGAERTFPFWALAFRAYAVTDMTTAATAACSAHAIVEASVEGDTRVSGSWYPARILICRVEPLEGGAEPDPYLHFTSEVVFDLDVLEVPHG